MRSFLTLTFLMLVSVVTSSCGAVFSTGVDAQLKQYETDDNPKALSRFLFHADNLNRESMESVISWSLGNRWQFLKFVDHLRGEDKERFFKEFPEVLSRSSQKAEFIERFGDSPSRSIQRIIELAK